MTIGRVEKYLHEKRAQDGALFFAIIDPLDYSDLDSAVKAAREAYEAGSDMIVVGGSTGVQGQTLDVTVSEIKKSIDVPLTLFPGNIATVTKMADAIYFMSMLNSRNPYWITGAQTLAAPVIKALGVEPLPVGYTVVGEGGTVAWIGDTNTIPLKKPHLAAAIALAARYMGFRFFFTDAGSAPPEPVPPEMVAAVRKAIGDEMFYIDAGGIRSEAHVRAVIKAGADAVQVGTAIESARDVKEKVQKLVRAVKEEGKSRLE
ncbi:MAG: geranylgeranylglyceryl/heptaprenylglyceryl phosphate synthase [Candidatus Altiarchaeota archaeon]|nr:geranylgeranylglyceryl/heptaprenylglyceryl phosphate synthase [Candidatus Altiarchaeota archaeon]